jgi:hypothetical protein
MVRDHVYSVGSADAADFVNARVDVIAMRIGAALIRTYGDPDQAPRRRAASPGGVSLARVGISG